MSAPPDKIYELLHSTQSCISDIGYLRTCLNLTTTRQNSSLSPSRELSISIAYLFLSLFVNAQFPFNQYVTYLGFALDLHLTMNAYVSTIAQTCYFELHHMSSIRRFLTSTATATLVFAFVLSRIDYYCSLLICSTHDVTSHLLQIQNYAAQVVLRLPRSPNMAAHLTSLPWLPVKVGSTYKIASLCYHCYSSTAPSYVTNMLLKKPSHTLNIRSSSYTMPLLNGPAHSKTTLGDSLFSFASSSVWNYSKWFLVCPITLIIYVLFEDILVLFSLIRLKFILHHCAYVHGMALWELCWWPFFKMH